MTKHIGIVACSAEGAALCYRTICTEAGALMGEHMHPEVTMHTHPLREYVRCFDAGDWDGVADLMVSSSEKVAGAGADFVVCPDNTIHHAFDQVVARSSLPWLHIAEQVAAEAKRQGYRRLGLLGTRHLMEGSVYPPKLASVGIERVIPGEPDRERIDGIIYHELVNGRFTAESSRFFREAIGRLKDRGCEAVVLGCTEIPLVVEPEDSPLPTLDSTRLLARAALREATGPAGLRD